jgi:GNAT superfamily N-acetyltransferase
MTDSQQSITLRFAEAHDTKTILGFIKELAEYEKLSHEVVTDESGLRKTLFGERRVAEVVIADFDGKAAGFALFFHNFSTFLGKPGIHLEDLYVQPGMRGHGIGKTLLSFLAKIAVERHCGRLEWAVLDWNEPAIGFYRSLGARSMDGWSTFRLDDQALIDVSKVV